MDVICFSGRDEESIFQSMKNYKMYSKKLILSRAINSKPLSNKILNIAECITADRNELIFRILDLAKRSDSDYLFLAADDDFIMGKYLSGLQEKMMSDQRNISCRIQTFNFTKSADSEIVISPYLNSPYVYQRAALEHEEIQLSNEKLVDYNFRPLCIDFYTIYDKNKLIYILTILANMSKEATYLVSRASKLFQYLLAFSILLAGKISNYNKPIYLRGDALPMRKDKKYIQNKVIGKHENMSFGNEVAELMENKQVWAELITALANIYQMYGHESEFRFNANESVQLSEISSCLRRVLHVSNAAIAMDLLDLYRSNYEARVSKDKQDKVSLSVRNKKYIFTLGMFKDLGNADKEVFSRIWSNFILDEMDSRELEQIRIQINE